ncbi:calcium-binding protein [Streptomyces sp. GMY02]|uniref:DUF5707 domain-containing protein n=1 Tax=Streptomyces sp. GMY02 TaxID=1333528 RepID=UPI001C2CBF65|nr:DUF5707 domain-containing protein [Streptomyces sp. GMY02]QXE36296.1 calcium-binding protein [Streptomyces sp. GMY02]
MRIRATVAVVSGALALSALAVPASQASQTAPSDRHAPAAGQYGFPERQHTAVPQAKQRALAATAANTAPVLNKIVVNGGKPIVVGLTGTKKVSVAITASDNSGIIDAATIIWIGSTVEDPNGYAFYQNEDAATCKAASATTSTCTLTVTVDSQELINTDARTWKVGAIALAKDQEIVRKDAFGSVQLQRLSRLTVNAAPEPVKKGKTITVTGKLDRVNWDGGNYTGYASQPVKLQFRKKNSTTYTTVKTVKGATTGALKTTVTASVDGYYRWSYAGSATTAPINATGDYIDVQ